ncbi:ParB/RepB/Spo0J family partition protein [Streptomyces longwoodensis]|uniref:ParB/RepB/Spo0J family partition protein n=1 Tax=Streptomyces longwoodensis TaxID=68231 RepID=UPI002253766C|nr:ParB/RepB/Spo0J family partition protein [Streptomyces longwoodensis]MCX5000938.1 ParB/RepB/Spo0J family partition protein [Streptomyces longwoodensis]
MSKADTLGPAPVFSAVRSARRNAISKIGTQGAAETVTELPVTVISDNPDNPRNHLRNLDETVETVREVGIILPIVVGTVEAYLHSRPDRADDLDDGAQYVVIDGHRRLEASRRVGLAVIPVRVDNARLATDETLLEAAFIANYHRDDMTDLEEAHALKQLVEYYGSQIKAAKRLGIAQGTISSKLSLLKLAPELQKDLMTGARTVEHVRNLGKLSPEEQKAKADERAEAARRRTEKPSPVVKRSSGPADYHGVIIPEAAKPEPAEPASVPEARTAAPAGSLAPAVMPTGSAAAGQAAVRSPAEQPTPSSTQRFPYEDAFTAYRHLDLKMPDPVIEQLTDLLIERRASKSSTA